MDPVRNAPSPTQAIDPVPGGGILTAISFSVYKDNLLDGSKRMTVRRFSRHRIAELVDGNGLQIYWRQRDPKESEKLFDALLRSITVFRFPDLDCDELHDLAREDGFSTGEEMLSWFIDRYGEETVYREPFMAIRFRRE